MTSNFTLISYCCGTYPSTGGVARYDTQLNIVFPNRIFFQGPRDKNKMLLYLKTCTNPIIITDNHLAIDIPNIYPIILVHHGVAKTHAIREPEWDKYWKDLCCNGQEKMLSFRDPDKTWIISISQFCYDEFYKYYPLLYPKFKNFKIFHSSELEEDNFKTKFNQKGIILGNWKTNNKGKDLIPKLKTLLNQFEFIDLNVSLEKKDTLKTFNNRKQNIYLNSDMFLQISLCEGFSYSALDALMNGLVVISTDVGLFYKDLPENCFVKLDWTRTKDVKYIKDKINYAWLNRNELSLNARKWYMDNCRFKDWGIKMTNLLEEFNTYLTQKNDDNH